MKKHKLKHLVLYTHKYSENGKGITLIALVVTIIVLLILAGISISMLTGENRNLKSSRRSKNKHRKSPNNRGSKIRYISKDVRKTKWRYYKRRIKSNIR